MPYMAFEMPCMAFEMLYMAFARKHGICAQTWHFEMPCMAFGIQRNSGNRDSHFCCPAKSKLGSRPF
jgi:hypothetical protein